MNFAVIGTGKIHGQFVRAALLAGHTVRRVVSRKAERADAFAKEFGIPYADARYEDALADGAVDAVYVASPHFCHFRQALAAIRAGKHVLCEKSMVLSFSDYLTLRAEAEEAGVILLEAVRGDFDPAFLAFVGAIGKVGKVRRVVLHFCQYSSRYDRFLAGEMPNAFRADLGNTALADIGVYPLHALLFAFGVPDRFSADSVFLKGGFEGEGTVSAVYSAEEFLACVHYSKITENPYPSYIEGEAGILSIDKISAPAKVLFTPRGSTAAEVIYDRKEENNMVFEIAAFAQMCESGGGNAPYLDVTGECIRMMGKIYEAPGFCYTDFSSDSDKD